MMTTTTTRAGHPHPARHPSGGLALRGTVLAAAVLCSGLLGALPALAQTATPAVAPGAGGPVPELPEANAPLVSGPFTGPGPATPRPGSVGAAPSAADRGWLVEPSITVRTIGSNDARLDGSGKKDISVQVTPSVALHSRGPRHRLDAKLGVDYLTYAKDAYPDRTDPVGSLALNSVLVPNVLFLDAGATAERRASTPFGSQNADVDVNQQVRTRTGQLSPYVQVAPTAGVKASLRSDNAWTHRSGSGVAVTGGGNIEKVYTRSTLARVEREPLPLGVGLELGEKAVDYNGQTDALRLQNALLSVGYALDPQFTVYLLGGKERSRFSGVPGGTPTTRTDSDTGLRLRWAPLERSILTAEARKRFFGNSYQLQWDHRSPFLGLKLLATREPYIASESMLLSGNLASQFDAIYQSRGFDAAQRAALVRGALDAYGLPDTLNDPATLYVNRAQLATTANAEIALMGRRTALVLSAYRRQLEQLQREGEPSVTILTVGDVKQTGAQAALSFRLTPMLSLETAYRHDRSEGLGLNASLQTRERTVSAGTGLLLSPRTRVGLSVQHQELDTTVGGRPPSSEATSATVTLFHRF
jgi:uncharacterized protein (PEP-CTERM system associated)